MAYKTFKFIKIVGQKSHNIYKLLVLLPGYMAREDLEKVVKSRVKPIIDGAMQKFIGARIVELESDISDSLAKNPLFEVEIDTSLKFRKAKDNFKRSYISKLLQTHLGNISRVADVLGIDRRSIHRLIKSLKINIEKIRKKLLSKEYAQEKGCICYYVHTPYYLFSSTAEIGISLGRSGENGS